FQPLYEALAVIRAEQFNLAGEVFQSSRIAVEDTLVPKFNEFLQTKQQEIDAKRAGQLTVAEDLLKQEGILYNALAKEYEQHLHDIKAQIESRRREAPRIHLPSLEYVGGSVIVDSPHATHTTQESPVTFFDQRNQHVMGNQQNVAGNAYN